MYNPQLILEGPVRLNAAAEFMGVHRRTIENWIERGLEWCRMGKSEKAPIYTSRPALVRFAALGSPSDRNETIGTSREEAEVTRGLRERHGL